MRLFDFFWKFLILKVTAQKFLIWQNEKTIIYFVFKRNAWCDWIIIICACNPNQ